MKRIIASFIGNYTITEDFEWSEELENKLRNFTKDDVKALIEKYASDEALERRYKKFLKEVAKDYEEFPEAYEELKKDKQRTLGEYIDCKIYVVDKPNKYEQLAGLEYHYIGVISYEHYGILDKVYKDLFGYEPNVKTDLKIEFENEEGIFDVESY